MIKLVIGLVIVVIAFIVIGIKNKKDKLVKAPIDFVQVSSVKSSTKHLPKVPINWIDSLEEKYSTQAGDKYDNVHATLSLKLCNAVYNSVDAFRQGQMSHTELLNEMTNEQRIYMALVNFEGQVNNGGVYQFLFNDPELSIIALEAFKMIGADKLAKDYEKVLHEYMGKFDNIQHLYAKFQDNSKDWDRRWNSFADGYKELPTAGVIDHYFYTEDFTKDYQAKIVAFVKKHKAQLMIEE